MIARPVLESCLSWPADEGIFFSVPAGSGAACPKFRDVRKADEGNAYEGTVTSIVSGAGNLISVFYDAEKRKWSISHAGFLREGRLIYDAAAYANARVAFLVREASIRIAGSPWIVIQRIEIVFYQKSQNCAPKRLKALRRVMSRALRAQLFRSILLAGLRASPTSRTEYCYFGWRRHNFSGRFTYFYCGASALHIPPKCQKRWKAMALHSNIAEDRHNFKTHLGTDCPFA
ncbi:unnamed protein product [Chondrus crispus]|uniref:Uncharacterized protein n=1 Tax=Chondrus crispus TaxID=2769 RepID=R7Q9X5_CHOCR|nr:unnamed protein product [Chondrus crispus]CDF34563.1 unnamed protein product [Chondrus crispus]|eukprot:XP_005714382.1 unnamed protein product [Chondrus crispus]